MESRSVLNDHKAVFSDITPGWLPNPVKRQLGGEPKFAEVACDHISFFGSREGQQALLKTFLDADADA